MDVSSYLESQGTYSAFVDVNYVNPLDVEISFPNKKRNLIYIFLESMETTYTDKNNGGAFDVNVIPELVELSQKNEDFSGKDQKLNGSYAMPGATWTMGAMFAQTSGIPLNLSIDGNAMDTQDTFFENVVTLGDILQQEGYNQILLIGSNANFGGRKLYFTEHGNYLIHDYDYAIKSNKLPSDYNVWWGYEDQKLFEYAKEELIELSNQDKPFNLTLLTVDTHFEDGYYCELCQNKFENNKYANVMACSSYQVNEFVKWVQQQAFYENTSIVIVGDHCTMDSDFCSDIDNTYNRRVYVTFINSSEKVKKNIERVYTTFDMFPTTLASLGVKISGDRLALGTNLFSEKDTLSEKYGLDYESKELRKKSKLIEQFANLDENKDELLMRTGTVPKADIIVDSYQSDLGAIPIAVKNFDDMQDSIKGVLVAVWTETDQSDLQWLTLEKEENESYFKYINIGMFGYKTGKYNIHVYIETETGNRYKIGETIATVE